MRGYLAWVGILSLLVAVVAGGAILFSALGGAPAAPPSALLAIGGHEGFLFADADGSGPRTIADDGPYFVSEWSADGTMVATTAVIGGEGNMLTVFAADGSRLARIPSVEDLRWSVSAGAILAGRGPGLLVLAANGPESGRDLDG